MLGFVRCADPGPSDASEGRSKACRRGERPGDVESGRGGRRVDQLCATKADFPSADYVSPFTVFNVKGNKYRLITLVDYTECIIVVRDVLTHAIYSKGKWK